MKLFDDLELPIYLCSQVNRIAEEDITVAEVQCACQEYNGFENKVVCRRN